MSALGTLIYHEKMEEQKQAYMGNVLCSILRVVTMGKSEMPLFSALFAEKADPRKQQSSDDIIGELARKLKKMKGVETAE